MATASDAARNKCCLSSLFSLGIAALFLWLALRVDKPKCYVKKFHVTALSKSLLAPDSSRSNTVINNVSFTLELENGNKDKGIRYDNVNLSFSMVDTQHKPFFPIGNATIAGFYQGKGKDALKDGAFQAHGVNWTRVSKDGKLVFRVDLVTTLKYKILFGFTKRHGLVRRANVEVNDSGLLVNPKGVRMESDACKDGRGCCVLVVVGILVHLVYLIHLHS